MLQSIWGWGQDVGHIIIVGSPVASHETCGLVWCGWGHNESSLSSCICQPYDFLFLCHGFIKFMYINKNIDENKTLIFYITCYNGNYFVSQPVSLDFASISEFFQWVWILQWVWIWKPYGPESLLYYVINIFNGWSRVAGCSGFHMISTIMFKKQDSHHKIYLNQSCALRMFLDDPPMLFDTLNMENMPENVLQ